MCAGRTFAVYRSPQDTFHATDSICTHERASLAADLRATRNDLQEAAMTLAPAIRDTLDAIGATPDCLLARMSGSGATCFGLFATPDGALRAAAAITQAGWWVWGGSLNRS